MNDIRKAITKEDLLKGTKKTEKVFIEELGGEIEIRPLNEEQWAEVEGISGGLFDFDIKPEYKKVNGKDVYDEEKSRQNMRMKLNVEKAQRANFQRNLIACKYGLVMDITEEELKNISPPGIIQKIAEKIFEISKISKEQLEDIKSFRGK
jgi:hypothetical protein